MNTTNNTVLDTALARLMKARTMLVLDHPFFGALALQLKLVADATGSITKSTATDGRSLFFNPEYVNSLSDSKQIGGFAHEVMHPAMLHHTRRGNREIALWNQACDYVINGALKRAGFDLPDGVLCDDRFDGQSAEACYRTLWEERQQQQEEEPDDEQDGEQGNSPSDEDGESDRDGDGEGERSGQSPVGGNEAGSGVQDIPGAILDAPDQAQDAADWQVKTKQAAQAAQMMGDLPGEFQRMLLEAHRPRFDVRSLLLRFVQERAKSDYSWKQPNRRYLPQGVYLPDICDNELGGVALVIDSSGSINDAIMAKFIGLAQEVVDQVRPRWIRVLVADAAVHADHTFDKNEPIEGVELLGGGGTDFRPAVKQIAEWDEPPACTMYLTDGYGAFPEESDYVSPMLWVMTTDVIAPNGETVRMEIDDV